MGLLLLVVVDAYEQQATGIVGKFGGIVLLVYLADGRISILVEFQLHQNGWRVNILTGYHHQVGKPFTGGVLTMNDIVFAGIVVSDGEDAGQ